MKRVRFLALALAVALVLMGAAYAAWSENMPIHGTVTTGELDWYFNGQGGQDTDDDYVCDPGFVNERQLDKDVARTTLVRQDTDGDGDYDTVKVTVTNAYPSYYNRVFVNMKNNGTIPIKVQQPVINSPGAVSVHWIDSVGTVLSPGGALSVWFEFRVDESALDNSTYTFTIRIPGIQWDAN